MSKTSLSLLASLTTIAVPLAIYSPTAADAQTAANPSVSKAGVIMKGENPDKLVFDFDPKVKAKKRYNIAVVVKSQAAPVWESHLIAAARAGEDMGVNVSRYAPTKADNVAEQKSMLEDIVTKGVDCVVIAPANSAAIQGPVAALVKKGIPVVYDNTLGGGDDYLSFVGVDSVQAGEVIAKAIGEQMKGAGKLLILEGVPGQQTSDDRVKGLKAYLDKNFPKITYKAVSGHWMFDEGRRIAEDTLQSWPDLGGIVQVGGNMSEGAAEAIVAAGLKGKVIIGSFDVQSPTVTALKNGLEAFTISQGVYEQAYYSVALCVKALNGEKVPREVRTPVTIVLAKDADEFDESPEVLKKR